MHHRELAGLGAFLPLDCVLTSETFAFSVSSTAVQSNYYERQPAYLHSLGEAGRCHPGLCWYTGSRAQWVMCRAPLKGSTRSPSTRRHACAPLSPVWIHEGHTRSLCRSQSGIQASRVAGQYLCGRLVIVLLASLAKPTSVNWGLWVCLTGNIHSVFLSLVQPLQVWWASLAVCGSSWDDGSSYGEQGASLAIYYCTSAQRGRWWWAHHLIVAFTNQHTPFGPVGFCKFSREIGRCV